VKTPALGGGDIAAVNASVVPIEYSDDALAQAFTERYGDDLRYTAAWGRWSVWNGHVWKADDTRRVLDVARDICRQISMSCKDPKLARHVASARTIAAVERLAQSDNRRHAATADQWDADPWILNTPGGIVDLKTGAIRPARTEDYCTKTTSVAPSGACTRWLAFLVRITNGDTELQAFLKRMCGYILTGVTQEEAMFFAFGTGANGKSKFLQAISGMLGDYAKVAPIDTFIDSKNQNHPTDLAGLQGARLVTASETEQGRRWAESKVKSLTGGDRISARYMRQDFFEYTPQFKLLVAGNHKPGLRTIDEAMRRRFNLLPFTVTIPPDERDGELGEKLKAEWSGILQWAIEGCLAWQREGLNPPAAVTAATEEYFVEEDALARWIEERTDRKDGFSESSSALWEDWKEWADSTGEFAGKQKQFSLTLEARGYRKERKNKGQRFFGIVLRKAPVQGGAGSTDSSSRARVKDKQTTMHNPTRHIDSTAGSTDERDQQGLPLSADDAPVVAPVNGKDHSRSSSARSGGFVI
jgi:putative DNA primase/helicase